MAIGISIVVYPYAREWLLEKEQKALLVDWPKIEEVQNVATVVGSIVPNKNVEKSLPENAIGILLIDAIDLELPVLDDSKPSNLAIAPMQIKGSQNPGEKGNFSIAGHRNKKYGKNFNRLDELKIGDTAVFKTLDAVYRYEVYKKQVVFPEAVEVLRRGNREEMTLVTCHPLGSSKQRLIVSLKRKEY